VYLRKYVKYGAGQRVEMNHNEDGVENGLLLRMIYHTERLKPFSDCGRTAFFLRVSSSSNQIHKVLKPFSVVNVRGPQIFQAVRRAEELLLRLGFR